jgi:hypothetical protein
VRTHVGLNKQSLFVRDATQIMKNLLLHLRGHPVEKTFLQTWSNSGDLAVQFSWGRYDAGLSIGGNHGNRFASGQGGNSVIDPESDPFDVGAPQVFDGFIHFEPVPYALQPLDVDWVARDSAGDVWPIPTRPMSPAPIFFVSGPSWRDFQYASAVFAAKAHQVYLGQPGFTLKDKVFIYDVANLGHLPSDAVFAGLRNGGAYYYDFATSSWNRSGVGYRVGEFASKLYSTGRAAGLAHLGLNGARATGLFSQLLRNLDSFASGGTTPPRSPLEAVHAAGAWYKYPDAPPQCYGWLGTGLVGPELLACQEAMGRDFMLYASDPDEVRPPTLELPAWMKTARDYVLQHDVIDYEPAPIRLPDDLARLGYYLYEYFWAVTVAAVVRFPTLPPLDEYAEVVRQAILELGSQRLFDPRFGGSMLRETLRVEYGVELPPQSWE